MPTIDDYINQLNSDKEDLVDNLQTKGIRGISDSNTFTELVPKVLDIPKGDFEWNSLGLNTPKFIIDEQEPIFDYSENIYNNWNDATTSTANMFLNNTTIKVMPLVNTEHVTNMSSMFQGATNLKTTCILNTHNVQNFTSMYRNCTNLTEIQGTGTIDSTSATNISHMFHDASSIKHIPDFSATSAITSGDETFGGCVNLEHIPYVNVSNATNLNAFCSNCQKQTYIPSINTGKNTNFNYFFFNNYLLADVPELDFSRATSFQQMLGNCRSLTTTSLNNLLKSFAGATSYNGTKSLYYVFNNTNMSSYYPASTIQGLSNYQEFTSAGWTIGWS